MLSTQGHGQVPIFPSYRGSTFASDILEEIGILTSRPIDTPAIPRVRLVADWGNSTLPGPGCGYSSMCWTHLKRIQKLERGTEICPIIYFTHIFNLLKGLREQIFVQFSIFFLDTDIF